MTIHPERKLIIVGGPTASGKSSYALHMAQYNNGVIINGDSMQIYKAIPTLTAQPTDHDHRKAPHKLYGILPISEPCTVAKWHKMACDAIDQCHNNGQLPIVVGGTGLYLDTLTHGLSYVPKIDPDIREYTRKLCDTLGSQTLHEKLRQIDPNLAERLNPNDKQRIARAYEVIKSSGKSLLYWQQQQDTSRIKEYNTKKIFVDRPRTELYQRAAQRLDKMLENGAIDEVKNLLSQSPHPNNSVMKALGVPEIIAYLNQQTTYDTMREKILLSTRHYIKRQLTWFRRSFQNAEKINP